MKTTLFWYIYSHTALTANADTSLTASLPYCISELLLKGIFLKTSNAKERKGMETNIHFFSNRNYAVYYAKCLLFILLHLIQLHREIGRKGNILFTNAKYEGLT